MPALRKSIRDRDFRSQPHRSSTTPYASPTGTPAEPAAEKKQRSITEWTEPIPQQLAPSFEEHGFARHGVLENMAPLGVPPKAKDKQRARALGEPAPRHAFLAKGAAAFADDVASTPEVTPAPELEPDDSERHDDEEMHAEYPLLDEDEDDDYEPVKKPKKVKISKTPVRGKTPVSSKTPTYGKPVLKNGHSRTASVSASPAVQAIQTPKPADAAQQRMLIAVNDAISRANKNDRRSVGLALKEIFEESKNNSYLAGVLDSIIHQNSTEEQFDDFRVRIKATRKRLKMESRKQQKQEERSSRYITEDQARSQYMQPSSPRASSEVAPDDSVSAIYDAEDQRHTAPTSPKPVTRNAHQALQSAIQDDFSTAPAHPFSTAPAFPAAESSAESTPRMPSKSPRKRNIANGNSEMDVDGEASTTAPTPAAKTPDTGASDSELSDVNEEIVQKGPPEPVHANGRNDALGSAAASKKGKNIALARAAKKSKGAVGKLFGKHAHKQQPPTAEQLAEDERLYEMRQSMAEGQLLRQREHIVPPVSDVRFDDEILETESLTESQIAVGPPVDSDQPRRAGRVPHQGTKRLREGTSRFSSPQLDSAVVTRPTTPAVGPAPKRIKLTNGQAARTKRSPVKNRDGGPIAGVAFNGGGASRQLGPDDNDPNSPQSESDDFCSACRGPGEFVCCEGCPRVFHLLCCDPPRTEVPDGAFYCYECNAKLAVSDEAAAESYISLGPLFKSLERINPRAFALPRDIQVHFAGVSARADGSFSEETKKFPLSKNSGYGYQKPDYIKVFDGEQKPILCTQCGQSSGGKRQMLKCDFCHAHWHLDCVDPPLANPPHISLEASQRDAWRCPRHIEHDLRSGALLQNDLNDTGRDVEMVDAAPIVRVARKVRRPREPEIIDPTFSRAVRNNGMIEIINDSDDDTDGEGNYVQGSDDPKDLNSKVFRIHEKGVTLDFISKVKSGRVAKAKEERKAAEAATLRRASTQNFFAHSIEQQQAALNLAQLARRESEIDFGEGKVSQLMLTLTSEAPPAVVTALNNAPLPPPTEAERAELLKLQELIQRRLKA